MVGSGFNIAFNYDFDTNNFFTPERRNTLELAASIWENLLLDDFPDLPPGYAATITNPSTGLTTNVILPAIDDLLVYAGAASPPFGIYFNALGAGGYLVTSQGSIFTNRYNSSDFEPWLGQISFDPTPNNGSINDWFFAQDLTTPIPASKFDFLSTALHELGHVLGITEGTPAFNNLVQNGRFVGVNAQQLNPSGIPLEPDLSHIQNNFANDTTLMDPQISNNVRNLPTKYDLALLADIGYQVIAIDGVTFTKQGSALPLATEGDDGTIFGTILADTIDGLGGNDQIQGNLGNDILRGGAGQDGLLGEGGADFLYGDGDNDQLQGGEGNDYLQGGDGNDNLFGEGDDDTLRGGAGIDYVDGGVGNDYLFGGGDDDSLRGDDNNDWLYGEAGNDLLQGDGGIDVLHGGPGDDQLSGGSGIDRFRFEVNNGKDVILDFEIGAETIEVSPELGFVNGAAVFATLTKPFSNVSRFTLSPNNWIDVFHNSQTGTPLTPNNFMVGDPTWTLDIDRNGEIDYLTDGVMVMRYLFGTFPGDALTNGAIGANATRTPDEIRAYLATGVSSNKLDVDGDGEIRALTDGIMIMRALSGNFAGDSFGDGAIGVNGIRDYAQVFSYINNAAVIV
jgi:hypothetical protein